LGFFPAFLVALAGCAAFSSLGGISGTERTATLAVQPQIKEGGFRAQLVISPYASPDINHLQIKLFRMVGGTEQIVLDAGGQEVMVDSPLAGLTGSAVFSNLAFDTLYRVKAFAYATAGTGNLISTSDNRSYVDVQVQRDDRPVLATVPVQLIDKVFSAEATASTIAVASGSTVHSGTESLAIGP
jgi:hypothetical protein